MENLIPKKAKQFRIKKKHLHKLNSCAYFGIIDCSCCKVGNTQITKQNKKMNDSTAPNESSIIKNEPSVPIKEDNKTIQEESGLIEGLINKPSTSTDIDMEFNFEEEVRKMKEYEEKFIKMIRNESIFSSSVGDMKLESHGEEEEIDVVNGSLEDVNLFQPSENRVKTSEQVSTQMNTEDVQEEIDVVSLNIPVRELNDIASVSTENNNNNSEIPVQRNTNRTRNLEQSETEVEEEIDVVNIPINELNENINTNIVTSKRKRIKSNTNMSAAEDEIIDVVNLTEDTPDFASLSTALVNSNRQLRSKPKHRSNQVIDLINTTIIEISDSPITPRVISGVINIDDDENTPQKSQKTRPSWGNCPVCFEDLTKCEIMSTMCGHVFCAVCIKTCIKTAKKCPKCRKTLTLKMIHPLFF